MDPTSFQHIASAMAGAKHNFEKKKKKRLENHIGDRSWLSNYIYQYLTTGN